MKKKPHLRVVAVGPPDNHEMIDTSPEAMKEMGAIAVRAVLQSEKLQRLLETRKLIHDALEVLAREDSVAGVMHLLRERSKHYGDRMQP